jgi:hypothetical protein
MKIEKATEKDFAAISTELDGMLKQFETTPFTLSLQLIQAHFMTFSLKNRRKAIVKSVRIVEQSKRPLPKWN